MTDKRTKSISSYSGEPFDCTNSSNPWLLNANKESLISDPMNGELLTADYIWNLSGQQRKDLVERVFYYYRSNVTFEDLVKPGLSKKEIDKEFAKLTALDASKCVNNNNEIKNSNSTGTKILKEFCGPAFYSSKGGTKSSRSCREVYEDDELFRAVLKNRMGWRCTTEDGTTRPYVFAISDKMIVQSMRSSGLAYTVSTFKPAVAKFIYSKWAPNKNNIKIFDPSAGWGARALGAGSLQYEYWGIDPLTHQHVNDMLSALNISGKVINGGSEFEKSYQTLLEQDMKNKFDLVFSSPPYFDLEIYKENDQAQSTTKFSSYETWLENFWRETVRNIKAFVLSEDGVFGIATVDKVKKHNLSDDMVRICLEEGLKQIDYMPFSTSKSHLSSKRKTKQITKTTEGVYMFSACNRNIQK